MFGIARGRRCYLQEGTFGEILPCTDDSGPGSVQPKLLAENFIVMYRVMIWGLPASLFGCCSYVSTCIWMARLPVLWNVWIKHNLPLNPAGSIWIHQPGLWGQRMCVSRNSSGKKRSRASKSGSTGKCVFVFWLSLCVVKVTFTRGHEITFVNAQRTQSRQMVDWQS